MDSAALPTLYPEKLNRWCFKQNSSLFPTQNNVISKIIFRLEYTQPINYHTEANSIVKQLRSTHLNLAEELSKIQVDSDTQTEVKYGCQNVKINDSLPTNLPPLEQVQMMIIIFNFWRKNFISENVWWATCIALNFQSRWYKETEE